MSNFVSHIKTERELANMTQAELAKRVNVRRETIVYLEKGRYIPSLKLAYRIAEVFGKTVEELFVFDHEQLWEE